VQNSEIQATATYASSPPFELPHCHSCSMNVDTNLLLPLWRQLCRLVEMVNKMNVIRRHIRIS